MSSDPDGISSDDLTKRANDEWHKIQEDKQKGEPNVSQASSSSITTNEEDKKRSMAEGIIQELGAHRQDIDSLKQGQEQIIIQQNQLAEMMNQVTQAVNNLAKGGQMSPQNTVGEPGGQLPKGLNMETLGALGDLAEKAVSAYKNLKGGDAPTQSFIDQNYINEQVKNSVMGNFDIGNALVNNLKSKLINKAVASSVTEALKDTHGPE